MLEVGHAGTNLMDGKRQMKEFTFCITTTPRAQSPISRALPLLALLLTALLSAIAPAGAAIVTQTTDAFTLRYDDDIVSIFGTPTIVGNSVRFTPASQGIQFRAEGLDALSGAVAFDILPNEGYRLSNLSLVESGDYSLIDADPTDGLASPSVLLGGTLRLTTSTDPVAEWVSALSLSDTLANPGLNNPFTAGASIEIGAQDLLNGVLWSGVGAGEYATITLQNELYAFIASPLDLAAIEKKLLIAPFQFEFVPVPLPGSLLLFGPLIFLASRYGKAQR